MLTLPFEIPKSLASYVEQFEEQPEKATVKLRTHLKKRGLDPIGYLLLGWFYYARGMKEQAIEQALKAKVFAPGSPFINLVHYYFSHPKFVDAWTPEEISSAQKHHRHIYSSSTFQLNLDDLISSLSAVESKKIGIDITADDGDASDLTQSSNDVDDIVSETLARIHEQQGKISVAISTYEKLKKKNPDRSDHYDSEIKRLEKEQDQE